MPSQRAVADSGSIQLTAASRETAPNRVLGGPPVRGGIGSHRRVPLFEVVAQVAVKDGGADLEEAVGGSVRPGHLIDDSNTSV